MSVHNLTMFPAIISFTFLLLIGCSRNAELDESPLIGTWVVDDATHDWTPRACVKLVTNDERLSLTFRPESTSQAVLNDAPGTAFVGELRRRSFTGRQLMRTTDSGRFCGTETSVKLTVRVSTDDENVLQGTWQTPECAVCPDRTFGARRR